jgi:transcriptional regulator with XRE-family HTH domain
VPEEGHHADEGGDPAPRGTFAERLDYLFKTVKPEHGPLTMDEVAARISAQGGERVSSAYLSALRRGVRDNPSLRTIEALARFFGVPATYFVDDGTAKEVRSQLELLTQLRESGVTGLKFRGADLTAESRSDVVKLLQQLAAEQQAAAARILDAAGAIEDEGPAHGER